MTPEEKKNLVESKVDEFEKFFIGLDNEPLSRPERAIVQTYVAWDLGLAREQEADAEEGSR
jgi:hypothetical protein